ncbi:hypothetical protein P7D01_26670 [Bacillus paranthracis]|nr:hypothetical protein [Bacillus paranthracis]HDR7790974.1 hypothetical protein [Bacillus paranthracis]
MASKIGIRRKYSEKEESSDIVANNGFSRVARKAHAKILLLFRLILHLGLPDS